MAKAKSQKEKLEAKLAKAKVAGDTSLVKAIEDELAHLKPEPVVPPAAPEAPKADEPKAQPAEEVSPIEARRAAALKASRAMGPNPLKRFRVVLIDGGYAVVNPDERVISPLDAPLSEGEANKLASRFNSLIKPPREALRKGGVSGEIKEE